MSRSYRRTPIFGNATAASEKQDKRITSGIFRATERAQIAAGEEAVIERRREALNPWSMAKDGKNWWSRATPKDMRK